MHQCFTLVFATLVSAVAAFADGVSQSVFLEDSDGKRFEVGEILFDGQGYELRWNEEIFENAFLSMRPFKCLQGPQKHWCRVPYPYANARNLADGWTDLEYDLLFIWKSATDYGIDMWNGVYYVLTPNADGLVGAMHDVNMDILAVPPEAGDMRPIREGDLEPADPDSHWLPRLIIE